MHLEYTPEEVRTLLEEHEPLRYASATDADVAEAADVLEGIEELVGGLDPRVRREALEPVSRPVGEQLWIPVADSRTRSAGVAIAPDGSSSFAVLGEGDGLVSYFAARRAVGHALASAESGEGREEEAADAETNAPNPTTDTGATDRGVREAHAFGAFAEALVAELASRGGVATEERVFSEFSPYAHAGYVEELLEAVSGEGLISLLERADGSTTVVLEGAGRTLADRVSREGTTDGIAPVFAEGRGDWPSLAGSPVSPVARTDETGRTLFAGPPVPTPIGVRFCAEKVSAPDEDAIALAGKLRLVMAAASGMGPRSGPLARAAAYRLGVLRLASYAEDREAERYGGVWAVEHNRGRDEKARAIGGGIFRQEGRKARILSALRRPPGEYSGFGELCAAVFPDLARAVGDGEAVSPGYRARAREAMHSALAELTVEKKVRETRKDGKTAFALTRGQAGSFAGEAEHPAAPEAPPGEREVALRILRSLREGELPERHLFFLHGASARGILARLAGAGYVERRPSSAGTPRLGLVPRAYRGAAAEAEAREGLRQAALDARRILCALSHDGGIVTEEGLRRRAAAGTARGISRERFEAILAALAREGKLRRARKDDGVGVVIAARGRTPREEMAARQADERLAARRAFERHRDESVGDPEHEGYLPGTYDPDAGIEFVPLEVLGESI